MDGLKMKLPFGAKGLFPTGRSCSFQGVYSTWRCDLDFRLDFREFSQITRWFQPTHWEKDAGHQMGSFRQGSG